MTGLDTWIIRSALIFGALVVLPFWSVVFVAHALAEPVRKVTGPVLDAAVFALADAWDWAAT